MTPTNQSHFGAGSTVALLNMSTTPPSIMHVFTMHADGSISGVGNSNISGTWKFIDTAQANMQVSINSSVYDGNALVSLSNLTIGFYMISSTNVGNFLFPQIVLTTLHAATEQVSKQTMSPYTPDGSGAGFQLAVFPDGFPKTAGPVALPSLKAADPTALKA